MTRRRPLRVAISVEPTILGDALTCVLRQAGVDEVVNLGTRAHAGAPAAYDAALVTTTRPADVDADIVIELPPGPSGTGEATVVDCGLTHRVNVHSLDDVVALLDLGGEAERPPYDAG